MYTDNNINMPNLFSLGGLDFYCNNVAMHGSVAKLKFFFLPFLSFFLSFIMARQEMRQQNLRKSDETT